MTLVLLIGLVMMFVISARFLKILDRAVDWLYLPAEEAETEDTEEEEEKEEPEEDGKRKAS